MRQSSHTLDNAHTCKRRSLGVIAVPGKLMFLPDPDDFDQYLPVVHCDHLHAYLSHPAIRGCVERSTQKPCRVRSALTATSGWPCPTPRSASLMATIDTSIMLIALPDIFRGIHIDPLAAGQQLLPAVDDPGLHDRDQRAGGEPRAPGRHVRPGEDVQPRFRRLHVLLARAHRHLDERHGGGALARRDARLPGRRGGVPHRQLVGDPHRRLPRGPAGHGARHQPGGRHQRLVHRPRPRRPARADPVAPHLLRLGADRALRHDLGLPQAARGPPAGPRPASTGRATSPSPSGSSALMVGITYGIQPYGGHTMGWTSPFVLGCLAGGVVLLVAFAVIEHTGRRPDVPPARCSRSAPSPPAASPRSCRHRPRRAHVHAGHLAPGHLAAPARLQLRPTPLWAGISMLPLTAGSCIAGPLSGYLSDRFGSRPFARAA